MSLTLGSAGYRMPKNWTGGTAEKPSHYHLMFYMQVSHSAPEFSASVGRKLGAAFMPFTLAGSSLGRFETVLKRFFVGNLRVQARSQLHR